MFKDPKKQKTNQNNMIMTVVGWSINPSPGSNFPFIQM